MRRERYPTMTHVPTILFICFVLLGCLDTATDPRPGPLEASDAEVFDVRPPAIGNNTGSGYGGSGNYQSGNYNAPPQPRADEDAIVLDITMDAAQFHDAGVLEDAGEIDDSEEMEEDDD